MKGQISQYAIVALIVLILIFLLNYNIIETGQKLNQNPKNEAQQILDSCLKQYVDQGIRNAFNQGGYATKLDTGARQFTSIIPYYLTQNNTKTPQIQELENSLSEYVDKNIISCLSKLEKIEQTGFEYTINKPNIKTQMNDEKIIVTYNSPIHFKSSTIESKIDYSVYAVDTKLIKLYKIAKKITKSLSKDTSFMCLSCYDEIVDANEASLTIVAYDESIQSFIFIIKPNDESYDFTFAIALKEVKT